VRELRVDDYSPPTHTVWRDLAWILGLGLLVLSAGLGLRDPWPADEPRFALIARDMVRSGEWLFPRVGGDWYQDKPPLFFWIIALFYKLTGSLRVAFLLPSMLAGLGTLVVVYDLGRRLWDREVGFAAALALLFTIQFSLQAHLAQIDALLCFWTTLSVYGLCRHLLCGHGWRWYALGGFAAGLGVITKGVGFLALLILLPYAFARWRQWPVARLGDAGWRWSIAPLAFLGAIAIWLVPMLVAVALSSDPQLVAYRDEILYQQTVKRYATAWHHNKPFYYYLTVMLSLWLPLVLFVPWLIGRWRERWRERDTRVLLLLGWIVLVLLFFTLSSGKRGVYILPALPIFAVVAGPWLRALAQRRDVQITIFCAALLLTVVIAGSYVAVEWFGVEANQLEAELGVNTWLPLALAALIGAVGLRVFGINDSPKAWATVLTGVWLAGGWWFMPQATDARSARAFVTQLESSAAPDRELGLLSYKEQFLLYLTRPIVNFGHARWREGPQEMHDAAAWLSADPSRQLLVAERLLKPCFVNSKQRLAGELSRERLWIVEGGAEAKCVEAGHAEQARTYDPARPGAR